MLDMSSKCVFRIGHGIRRKQNEGNPKMNYPELLRSRFTRSGVLVSMWRYPVTGYWEVTTHYGHKMLFDTGRAAWAYYRKGSFAWGAN